MGAAAQAQDPGARQRRIVSRSLLVVRVQMNEPLDSTLYEAPEAVIAMVPTTQRPGSSAAAGAAITSDSNAVARRQAACARDATGSSGADQSTRAPLRRRWAKGHGSDTQDARQGGASIDACARKLDLRSDQIAPTLGCSAAQCKALTG